MKKRALSLILVLAMLIIQVPAFATADSEAWCVYDLTVTDGYTVTPMAEDSTTVTMTQATVSGISKNAYIDVVKFTVSFTGTTNVEYGILLLSDGATVPTQSTIRYIDQKTGAEQMTFTVYPDTLQKSGDYTILLSTPDTLTTVATFSCGVADSVASAEPINIAGTNMVLGNELAMNFWIPKTNIVADDYYAVVTKTYADAEDVTVKVDFADWEDYSSGYYRVNFSGIAAKEMADELYVQVFNADGTEAGEVWTDSIMSYGTRIFNNQSDANKTWIVDMLNYGAASQEQFGYNTDNLANAALTAEQQAYATESVEYTDHRVKGTNYFASTLVLESNICLTMYFNGMTTDMYAEVEFTDHYGNAVSERVEGSEFNTNSGYLGVPVTSMVAADARQLITVTVYNADGSVYGSASDSVEGYAARMASSSALYDAIMKFVDSSYTLLH